MQPVHSPVGGAGPLIDKMIGNAYDIVKYVAKYLKEIRYVAENMEKIWEVAQQASLLEAVADNMTAIQQAAALQSKQITVSLTPAGLDYANIALPYGYDLSNLRMVSVVARNSVQQLYLPAPDRYTVSVTAGGIYISNIATTAGLRTAVYYVTLQRA